MGVGGIKPLVVGYNISIFKNNLRPARGTRGDIDTKELWPLKECVLYVQAAKPVYSDSSLDKLW